MKLIREEIESVEFITEEKNGKKGIMTSSIFFLPLTQQKATTAPNSLASAK